MVKTICAVWKTLCKWSLKYFLKVPICFIHTSVSNALRRLRWSLFLSVCVSLCWEQFSGKLHENTLITAPKPHAALYLLFGFVSGSNSSAGETTSLFWTAHLTPQCGNSCSRTCGCVCVCVCVCAHVGILSVIKSTHTCLRPDATVNSAPVTMETEWDPDREFREILEKPMRDGDGINERTEMRTCDHIKHDTIEMYWFYNNTKMYFHILLWNSGLEV